MQTTPQPYSDPNALLEIDKMRIPIVNVRVTSNLALTPFQLFAFAFNLFMLAAPMMRWVDTHSPTFATLQCFGGFCLWLSGFFDWANGRTLLCTVDFLISLLNFSWFLIVDLTKYRNVEIPESCMKGGFLACFFAIWLVIVMATSQRGLLYMIGFFLVGFGITFHMIFEFSSKVWSAKTAGYFYFFASIVIWITGIGKGMNDIFGYEIIPLVLPNL